MSLTVLDFPQITTNNGRVTVSCHDVLMMTAVSPREECHQDRWLLGSECLVIENPEVRNDFVVTMPAGATVTPIMLGGRIPYAIIAIGRNTFFTIGVQHTTRRRQLRCFSGDLLRQFIAKFAASNGVEAVPTLSQLGL